MKLGYFTMPLHPPQRNYVQTLKEDREAILLADRLDYCEAFVGEHVTDIAESVTSCAAFLASLVHDTKRIRLGTGTLNLPNGHPAQLAATVSMLDNMLEGRFIVGISPGGLPSDWEVFEQHGRRPHGHVRGMHRPHDRDLDRRAALQPQGPVLERLDREDHDSRHRPGDHPQALPEAAPPYRGHRGRALLQGRHRGRQARLGPDLGQLPAAAVGEVALAEVRRGLRRGGAQAPTRPTGAWRRPCSSPTTRPPHASTVSARTAPTASTTSSCSSSSSAPAASTCSSLRRTRPTSR